MGNKYLKEHLEKLEIENTALELEKLENLNHEFLRNINSGSFWEEDYNWENDSTNLSHLNEQGYLNFTNLGDLPHIMQDSENTCVPASLLIILAYFGIKADRLHSQTQLLRHFSSTVSSDEEENHFGVNTYIQSEAIQEFLNSNLINAKKHYSPILNVWPEFYPVDSSKLGDYNLKLLQNYVNWNLMNGYPVLVCRLYQGINQEGKKFVTAHASVIKGIIICEDKLDTQYIVSDPYYKMKTKFSFQKISGEELVKSVKLGALQFMGSSNAPVPYGWKVFKRKI